MLSPRWLAYAALFSLACVGACATGSTLDDDDDKSADGGGGDDASSSASSSGSIGSSSGAVSSSSSGGGGSSSSSGGGGGSSSSSGGGAECGTLVINEVHHTGNPDFVEIYNAGDCDVDIDNYSLAYRSSTGNSDAWTVQLEGTLGAGDYYVLGESGFSGPKDGNLSGGLGANGGSVALKRGSTRVDSVGWGEGRGNYVEGTAAPAAGSNRSLQRSPDGHDTDDNASDFVSATPTPGRSN